MKVRANITIEYGVWTKAKELYEGKLSAMIEEYLRSLIDEELEEENPSKELSIAERIERLRKEFGERWERVEAEIKRLLEAGHYCSSLHYAMNQVRMLMQMLPPERRRQIKIYARDLVRHYSL